MIKKDIDKLNCGVVIYIYKNKGGNKLIRYKIPGKEILLKLKEKGYSSTYLVKSRIFGEKTMTYLRHDKLVSLGTIDKLCELLNCQISDLIYYESTSDNIYSIQLKQ